MAAALKQRIEEDIRAALRQGDKQRLTALRLALAAIKQREIDGRAAVDDTETVKVLEKLARQRRESIEAYEKGGRHDLVEQETFELHLIQGYLPERLSRAEVERLIERAIAEVGASAPGDLGRVMARVKILCQGRADLSEVSGIVRERLTS